MLLALLWLPPEWVVEHGLILLDCPYDPRLQVWSAGWVEVLTALSVRCYALLGDTFADVGERERAIELYGLAVERLGDRSGAYVRDVYSKLAQLLEDEGRKDEAFEMLKKALQVDVEAGRAAT